MGYFVLSRQVSWEKVFETYLGSAVPRVEIQTGRYAAIDVYSLTYVKQPVPQHEAKLRHV